MAQQPHVSASTQSRKFINRITDRFTSPFPGTDHDQLFYWQGYDPNWGIPNCLREKLLQLGLGEAALLLDACFMSDLDRGDRFTYDALADRLRRGGIDISPGLVRRALSSGLFPVMAMHQPKRGRPQLQYTMPSIEYLCQQYEAGYWLTTDPLEKADLTSLRAYRAALHREFIRRAPGSYSRAFLGRRLGVSKSATRNYDEPAGVVVKPRYERTEINYYVNALDLVPRDRVGWHTWMEIKPQDKPSFRAPPKRAVAANWLDHGAWITVVKQLTNRYARLARIDWRQYEDITLPLLRHIVHGQQEPQILYT